MYRASTTVLLAFAALLALSGCGARARASREARENAENQSPKESPVASQPADPDVKLGNFATFPEDLKHDGFLYGGFNQQVRTQSYRLTTPSGKSEGKVTTRYMGEVDGKYTFSRERTDGLQILGNDTVAITKSGVEIFQVTLGTLDKPYIEVPAKLTPGTTWSVKSMMESPNGTIKENSTFKAVGEESVTVPAGTMKALKVVGTGTGSAGEIKFDTQSEFWMSKTSGLIKFSVTQKPKQGDSQTVTLELTK